MYTDIHTEFIQTPIRHILEQGINASHSLTFGIESFPMSEYYLQSIFLRMTGAAEQKMKCILWQMATDDYQYRNKYLNYNPSFSLEERGIFHFTFSYFIHRLDKFKKK